MTHYILRRLLLFPITLFCIVLVNFAILNMAPGDPTSQTEISSEGAALRREQGGSSPAGDERYLQFREFYGLTLPLFWNSWPWISLQEVTDRLWRITYKKESPTSTQELSFLELQDERVAMGDRARFVMGHLLAIMKDTHTDPLLQRSALHFFIRGGMRQAELGPTLTQEQKAYNRKIERENSFLSSMRLSGQEGTADFGVKVAQLNDWYQRQSESYHLEPKGRELVRLFFAETRFWRYMSRILTLDFGTLRNDNNKTVWSEVTKRFKYSLTLSLLPMLLNFALCQLLGAAMAFYHNRWPDVAINFICLFLYACPIFVVAPFLIETFALQGYHFPWTQAQIPLSGFTSPEIIYSRLNSQERLADVLQHIALPLIAILYGGMAAQARLSRTAILEVLRQDYVRTARAKGVGGWGILTKHVGRNAAITIVTSIASSLGVVLGGSLIVESLFQIDGFGKFFYDAIVSRDYNVVMFSALAGSFLSLLGYLVADLSYAALDPRVTFENSKNS